MECDFSGTCPFRKRLRSVTPVSIALRSRFCLADFEDCARRHIIVALGPESVPPDLYPHEAKRAARIIARAQPAGAGA